jgi:hypothetical protein
LGNIGVNLDSLYAILGSFHAILGA